MEVVWDREERGLLLLHWESVSRTPSTLLPVCGASFSVSPPPTWGMGRRRRERTLRPCALCPGSPLRACPPVQSCPPTLPPVQLCPRGGCPGAAPAANISRTEMHWVLLGPSQQGGRSNPFSLLGSWQERWGGGPACAGNRTGTANEVGLKPAE